MGGKQRLNWVENLTIYHAQEHKERLLAALDAGSGLELDLSQVGEIDTAGLQLLILAKQEAARKEKSMAIVAHSQAVRSVIDFCNLAAELGDPLVIPAAEVV